MILSRDSIIARNDLPRHSVEVIEWGGEVLLRECDLVGLERLEKLVRQAKDDDIANLRASIVQLSLCDEKGNLLFSEDETPLLAQKSAKALTFLATETFRINRLHPTDIEEKEKNLERTISSDSDIV